MSTYLKVYLSDIVAGVKGPLAMPIDLADIIERPEYFQIVSAINILLSEYFCRVVMGDVKYLRGVDNFVNEYELASDINENQCIQYAESILRDLMVLGILEDNQGVGYRGMYIPETHSMAVSVDGLWLDEVRALLRMKKS